MRNDVKDQFLRLLLEPRTLQRGYFKPEAVKSLVDVHICGRRNRSGLLWRMLVLELWHRNFMESRAHWTASHKLPQIFSTEAFSSKQSACEALARQGREI
jgi:hypothetical protein